VRRSFITLSESSASASDVGLLDLMADVTFTVKVRRPMGVIFGENPKPLLGLVIDDVSPGLNGGAAGLRTGDQLVAVNGQMVVGREFDDVMALLQTSNSSPFSKLCMFRGSALDLNAVMSSFIGPQEEVEEDVVVIDENYEAPRVVFEDKQEKPLTADSVLNIFKKIGSNAMKDMSMEGQDEDDSGNDKKKGLFGGMFGGETIQLDGNDASTVK
jgi:PDZ domain